MFFFQADTKSVTLRRINCRTGTRTPQRNDDEEHPRCLQLLRYRTPYRFNRRIAEYSVIDKKLKDILFAWVGICKTWTSWYPRIHDECMLCIFINRKYLIASVYNINIILNKFFYGTNSETSRVAGVLSKWNTISAMQFFQTRIT